MINPQLLNYVRAQRAAGVPKEEIIKALSGGGWSAQDAQEAFAAIEGVQVPPQPPKPMPPPIVQTPAPAPVAQPRPVQPVAPQPIPTTMQTPVGMQPIQTSVRIQPQPVVQRQPVYAQVKKRRVWPWIFLLVLFLIGGFVGGAYAAIEYPWVEQMAQEIKNMISPTTLEPVDTNDFVTDPPPTDGQQNNLPSFMPQIDPLGASAGATTTTGSASTTPR